MYDQFFFAAFLAGFLTELFFAGAIATFLTAAFFSAVFFGVTFKF